MLALLARICPALLALAGAADVRLRSSSLRRTIGANSSALRLGKDVDFNLKLTNFQNVQYFGDFTAGGQTMPVIYDTGSFEVIVLSTRCKKCESGSPMYDPRNSNTFSEGDKMVAEHVFGSGPVLSEKGIETIELGDSGSPLYATGMPFWQVLDHDIDVWDKYSKFSGIVGFGHSSHAPDMDGGSGTSDNDVVLLERLGVNSFSVCLERSTGTPPGWISMGPAVEQAQHSSGYWHVPVVGDIHWAVQMTYLAAGGNEGFDACSPSCAAILDSGTSLIAAPASAMKALAPVFNLLNKDCSNLDQMPDITFRLGNDDFTLPPAIYVLQLSSYVEKAQSPWERLFNPPELESVTECTPAFMQMDKMTTSYGPAWILGMPFLRYYHATFQRSPKMVHIAYADSKCNPTSTPPNIFTRVGFSNVTGPGMNTSGSFAKAHKVRAGAQASRVELPQGAALHHPVGASGGGVVRVPAWAMDKKKTIDL